MIIWKTWLAHMHEHAISLTELKGYELRFNADEKLNSINLNMQKRQAIYLIYKEALNNIVKYACGKQVWICIRKEKSKLLLTLKDDGVGFDVNKCNGGNGLQNMKNRAAFAEGTITICSKAGCGSEVNLSISL